MSQNSTWTLVKLQIFLARLLESQGWQLPIHTLCYSYSRQLAIIVIIKLVDRINRSRNWMNMNLEIEDPFSRLNWVVNEMEWDHCLPNFLSLHLLFLFFSSQPMKENKDQQNDTIILRISIHFWLDRLWAFILMFPLPCSSNPLAFLNVGSSSSMIKNLVQTLYLIEGISGLHRSCCMTLF